MRTPGSVLRRFVALALAGAALAPAARAETASGGPAALRAIQAYRAETWRWERLMRARRTPNPSGREREARDVSRRRALAYWRRSAARARRAALHPPRLAAWLCIHRHEGRWNANTGNGYYGGLQMNLAFQRRYAPELLREKGPAHRWSWVEQIWVAERAYRAGAGFTPWPNAARACGLR